MSKAEESYFSDRENGPKPRNNEVIPPHLWQGIWALVLNRIADGSFGVSCPIECENGGVVTGTHERNFFCLMRASIPSLPNIHVLGSQSDDDVPRRDDILDLIDFCYQHIAKPKIISHHEYFKHNHLEFDENAGKQEFRKNINMLFSRNEIAFEMDSNGLIRRTGPALFQESIGEVVFNTGDARLDKLLGEARRRFRDPKISERHAGVEKLWDAFERVKVLEDQDTKKGTSKIIDAASQKPVLRDVIDADASALTTAGNRLAIRHHKRENETIEEAEQLDYLFMRLFALLELLLRRSNRM